MATSFTHLIRIALGMPLRVAIVKALKKIGCNFLWLRKLDFRLSPAFMRPAKSSLILLNSMEEASFDQNILKKIVPYSTVLEIGCGEYFGLAPFSFCLKAKRYIGIDPCLEMDIINLNEASDKFLTNAFIENTQILSSSGLIKGEATKSRNKIKDFFEICSFIKLNIDQVQLDSKIDVCFSISCLEHIQNFDKAAETLANIGHPKTVHYHIVNFSNHISKRQPFKDLYENPYELFAKKWNNNINGLRVTDMLEHFEGAKLKMRSIVVDKNMDVLPDTIDDYWLSKYSKEELATRVAILTNL
mgnify:CR=1 FL=1